MGEFAEAGGGIGKVKRVRVWNRVVKKKNMRAEHSSIQGSYPRPKFLRRDETAQIWVYLVDQ